MTAGPIRTAPNRLPRLIVVVLVLLATAVAAAPGSAAASVYAAAWNAARIDEFTIGAGGLLAPLGSVSAGDTQPWYMAMTPDARHLYVTSYSGKDVVAFDVGASGALTQKDPNNGGQVATGVHPVGIAVSPDGKNIYVANYSTIAGTVSLYDIAADGSLAPKATNVVSAGKGSYGVAVSPDGTSVYVANSSDDTVSQFDRAPDGSIAPKSPATVPVAAVAGTAGPSYIALTPDGKHLYTANYNNSTVGTFDVGAGGTLTEKAGAPAASASGPYLIAVSPDGRSLYAPGNFDGKLSQYDIGADGALLPKTPASLTAGVSLDGIWLSPDGKNAYVSDAGTFHVGANTGFALTQFDLSGAGLLAPKSPLLVATSDYPAGVMVAPDQGPTASFLGPPAASGAAATFDATASSDPDGSIARYLWDFGDGTPPADAAAKPSHTYAALGTYTVSLTLFDDAGCSTTLVYTGTTAYCNGTAAGTTTRSVTIGPAGPAPAPAPAGTPLAKLPTFASFAVLPSTKQCVSRRRFQIRLRSPRGLQVTKATVKLDGRLVATRRGSRLTAPVDLRGLPKGRFSVTIEMKLVDGRSVRATRRYRTCALRRRAVR